MNFKVNEPAEVIKNTLDKRWVGNTIYNHYDNPRDFMEDVIANIDKGGSRAKKEVEDGIKKYEKLKKDTSYNKLFEDVSKKVRNTLITKGFTTKLLYGDVEFTTENTGCMSKQRAMLGRRDCYFKDPRMSDGKLFHDIYVNLSYSWGVSDSVIERNSYALYALCKEMARLIPIRVFVINHVGTDTPTCYSYCIKKFRQPINPAEFLFFTSESKRTFGWATYKQICGADNSDSQVGRPSNTVSIDSFNLDREVDTIWEKFCAAKNISKD